RLMEILAGPVPAPEGDGGGGIDQLTQTPTVDTVLWQAYSRPMGGRINSRMDLLHDVSEDYVFDHVGRLTDVSALDTGTGATQNQTVSYDGFNTMSSMTGMGSFDTTVAGQVQRAGARVYTHDGNGRVDHVGVDNAFGNDPAPYLPMNIHWTGHGKVQLLDSAQGSIQYSYGPDGNWVQRVYGGPAIATETTTRMGRFYERHDVHGGSTEHRYTVGLPDGTVMVHTQSLDGEGTLDAQTKYVHRDLHASAAAITNETGDLLAEPRYSIWGQPTTSWVDGPGVIDTAELETVGFGGHASRETFEMVNMEGRLFDPVSAHFMEPDPYTQNPNVNRYAYVNFDPVNNTDPSGLLCDGNWCGVGQTAGGLARGVGGFAVTAGGVGVSLSAGTLRKAVHFIQSKITQRARDRLGYNNYQLRTGETTVDMAGYPTHEDGVSVTSDTAGGGTIGGAGGSTTEQWQAEADEEYDPFGQSGRAEDELMQTILDDIEPSKNAQEETSVDWNTVQQELLTMDEVDVYELGVATGALTNPFDLEIPSLILYGHVALRHLGRAGKVLMKGIGIGRRTKCFVAGTQVHTENGKVNIEAIQVGDRVLPAGGACNATDVHNDSGWFKVVLKLEDFEEGRHVDTFEVSMLRSAQWLKDNDVVVGKKLELAFDEISIHGMAAVVAVEPMSRREEGEGCLVTMTVTHLNNDVHELRFKETSEVLRPTGLHRLWSLDRKNWVPTGALRLGERLAAGDDGFVTVAEVERLPGVQQVFNIEVQAKHSYRVGSLGIWSHNNGRCGRAARRAARMEKLWRQERLAKNAHPGNADTAFGVEEYLDEFADATGGVPHYLWHESGHAPSIASLDMRIFTAMSNTVRRGGTIHFNLKGLSSSGNLFTGNGSWTNREFGLIMTTEQFFKNAKFYYDDIEISDTAKNALLEYWNAVNP
ncbi:MAG: RHS repeat-associated core domain-containing protein, partial [Myxococcota bacterium]